MNKNQFLSDCLGYPVYEYKIPLPINRNEKALYYIKVPASDPELQTKLDFLQVMRFKLITTNLIFQYKSEYLNYNNEQKIELNIDNILKYSSDILDIAGTEFKHNRFYADFFISQKDADFIMQKWVYNCLFENRSENIFINVYRNKVRGFLSVLRQGNIAWIDLIAVNKKYQGRGIGFELMNNFKNVYDKTILKVGTQITNIPAISLYCNSGFEIIGSFYWFHLHTGI